MRPRHVQQQGNGGDSTILGTDHMCSNALQLQLGGGKLFGAHFLLQSVDADTIRDFLLFAIVSADCFDSGCNKQ